MSNKNYDVELNITYSNTYRHYIPSFKVAAPNFSYAPGTGGSSSWSYSRYNYYVSFDEDGENELGYAYRGADGQRPPVPLWNVDGIISTNDGLTNKELSVTGFYSKVYFRNKYPSRVAFTSSNCFVSPIYNSKALFEIQFNSTGFAANQNAWFKCSTIPKPTLAQYEWIAATVYYKKSTDSSYTSAEGTVSGSWSDVRIDTEIDFEDGYIYDVYIHAVADDNSTANTPVAQFTTTDAAAVSACISPVGAFTQGDITFVWSHATEYGTPQYAYDLQYSSNDGSSWVTVSSHVVTTNNNVSITLNDAGVYKWRVRTYNSNDVAGEWAEASFVNNVPANPPTNLAVNTKGRPTVSWASVSQSAYQIQFLMGDIIVYDSGAVYTTQTSHFVNQYFNDQRSYVVRLRIYNALGEVSEWVETGYQQPSVTDVLFSIESSENGGAIITIEQNEDFSHYYLLRDSIPIAEVEDGGYVDLYAVGLVNYSVVGVTSEDQSDIQTTGYRVNYPHATVTTLDGQQILVNKRVNEAYEVQTSNEADVNKVSFMGDSYPTYYPSNMRLKSFSVICFDDQDMCETLLGNTVFYADNFGNGGYCIVKNYEKTDNFIQNSKGVYANEVSLTLEVTNYDDSIQYPL